MDDPLLMRGFQGFRDLFRDGEGFIDGDRSLRDAFGERRPLDQLHHESLHAVGVFEAVDLSDVGMIQGGQDLGFALEPREAIRIGGDGLRQHLDRDLALQLRVGRLIHLAHAACADLGGDFIRAEAGSGGEGHPYVYPGMPGFYWSEGEGCCVRGSEVLATLVPVSWNRLVGWLKDVEALQRCAA